MNILAKFKCPYCGFEQYRPVEKYERYLQIETAYCDEENGGCGRLLAIGVEFTIHVTVYKLEEVRQ
jgi:hypothetical protein